MLPLSRNIQTVTRGNLGIKTEALEGWESLEDKCPCDRNNVDLFFLE